MNAVTETCDWKKSLASSTTHLRIKQLTEELKVQAYTAISRKVVEKMCTPQSRKVIWDTINTLFLTL